MGVGECGQRDGCGWGRGCGGRAGEERNLLEQII